MYIRDSTELYKQYYGLLVVAHCRSFSNLTACSTKFHCLFLRPQHSSQIIQHNGQLHVVLRASSINYFSRREHARLDKEFSVAMRISMNQKIYTLYLSNC